MTNAVSIAQSGSNNTTFRNRIINGAMVIDQRNAGASVTPTATATKTYGVDRFYGNISQASKFSMQQNAGAVTPPTGFKNYFGVTSSSAYTVLTGDYFLIGQVVEGLNVADFDWGTANAATVTLSFWVRSSLTGTFGGSFVNSAANRSYPFSYTISAANTWEQKTLTIAGDTSGTWLTTSGIGIEIRFGLGVGATYSGTANTWQAGNFVSPTGATSVVGTNGATFYITGVQLEKGSTASPFEYRLYGTEFALCQRYFQVGGSTSGRMYAYAYSSTTFNVIYNAPVALRTAAVITLSTTSMSAENVPWITAVTGSGCTVNQGHASTQQFDFLLSGFTGLTVNQPATIVGGVYFSAEL